LSIDKQQAESKGKVTILLDKNPIFCLLLLVISIFNKKIIQKIPFLNKIIPNNEQLVLSISNI